MAGPRERDAGADALIRLIALVTESGTMPPVTWSCRSMPTNAGESGSDHRGGASAARRPRYAFHASTGLNVERAALYLTSLPANAFKFARLVVEADGRKKADELRTEV
ncbi:hypothetical protein [Streptomyces sp. NPDC057382]|uniref:hypothetical protein n=1 Tax=unclassified Streptomyces TaxID=2593676 RepID=UPI0036375440